MITTTFRNIHTAVVPARALGKVKLPVKAAYAVSKLGTACDAALAEFNKIFTDAGFVNQDGKFHHADPAVYEATMKKAEELLDAPVEINALPLDIEQFGNAEVPGFAFVGLEWAMKT